MDNNSQIQDLQIALEKVTNEKNQQDILLLNLKQQLVELKNELSMLKQNQNAVTTNLEPEIENTNVDMQYCTDEEELAKETDWIRVKHKKMNKKRKLNNTPSPISQKEKQQHQFGQKDKQEQISKKISVPPPPPPIIVDGIKDYNAFYDVIKQKIPDGSITTKLLHQNSIKINVKNDDAYRQVIKTLLEGHFSFHTYENKQQRPIRVIVRNLHHTCSTDRIIDDLARKNLKVIDATNKISWRKKIPLDMFILSFPSEENVTKIYEISNILGCKVQIEPLKKSKLIPQCKKCQAYGHTQKYCSKSPRCVKCAGHHLTAMCDKLKTSSAKCVHCGEAHPASYRGCMIAKEIQKIKNQRMNKRNVPGPNHNVNHTIDKIVPIKNAVYPLQKNKNTTYADILIGENSNSTKNKEDDECIKQTLHSILMKLTKFDERLEKLENCVKGAKPKINKNA